MSAHSPDAFGSLPEHHCEASRLTAVWRSTAGRRVAAAKSVGVEGGWWNADEIVWCSQLQRILRNPCRVR